MQDQNESGEIVEAQLLERLGVLLKDERLENSRWEVGDIILKLRARFDWCYAELAQLFHYSRPSLIQFAKVAEAFPENERQQKVPFQLYRYSREASDRIIREVSLHKGIDWANLKKSERPRPDYAGDLKWLVEQRAQGVPLTDQRQVTVAMAAKARSSIENTGLQRALLSQGANSKLVNHCHNRPCAEVIRTLKDRSVKLFHFDPPFGNYRRDTDGHLDISTSVGRVECDNDGLQDAIAVTVEAIREAEPKLETNGVMLLWQASTMPAGAIATVVEELSLGGVPFIIWDKRKPKLGDGVEALQYSTEVCFVLCRRGEKPLIHDPALSKLQIISEIGALTYSLAKMDEYHQMQKPVELLERLVRQFTRQGDVVFDGFGCSGSFCVAAERLGRNWIYCESNQRNFSYGKANIGRELTGLDQQGAA